jgi:signal transduction histidine kinase
MDAPQTSGADIELSLLRVVVGYRVFGTLWLAVLAGITLADRPAPDRAGVVVVTAIAVAAWTAVVIWLSFRRSRALRSVAFLVADTLIAAATLVAPDLAGSGSFAGGYALAAVFHGAYAFSWTGAISVAAALSAVALWQVNTDEVNDLTASSGAVLVYGFAAAAAAWTLSVIRHRDALRVAAEAALAEARAEQARAEERAELAARIHDGVLQTLALIQRDRDNGAQVAALARHQERELRTVLYGRPGTPGDGFRASLTAACAQVEDLSGIRIDVVTVGDRPWGPEVEAIVAATREAVINAAKHAHAGEVSVYGEVHGGHVTVFVRDRGVGFDPAAVAPGRRGIAESIERRLAAVGGHAEIKSAPGAGTEVKLEVGEPV